MILNIFIVALGGCIGTLGRYFSMIIVNRYFPTLSFPIGTLCVNVIGCFLIGFLGGLGANKQLFAEGGRLFLFTGILGGFTTFSAFGIESYTMIRSMQWQALLLNISLQLFLGLGAVALGYWLSELIN